jgi:hypothetical protein
VNKRSTSARRGTSHNAMVALRRHFAAPAVIPYNTAHLKNLAVGAVQ